MLQLDFSKVVKESVKREYKGVNTWIKPYPVSKEDLIGNEKGFVITGESRKNKFIDVIEKWDMKNTEGKSIACTKENKAIIYDNGLAPDYVEFVLEESDKIRASQRQSEKNS